MQLNTIQILKGRIGNNCAIRIQFRRIMHSLNLHKDPLSKHRTIECKSFVFATFAADMTSILIILKQNTNKISSSYTSYKLKQESNALMFFIEID